MGFFNSEMRELHFFCLMSLGRALCVVVVLKVKILQNMIILAQKISILLSHQCSFSKCNQRFGNKMVVYFLYTILRRQMFNRSRWKNKIAATVQSDSENNHNIQNTGQCLWEQGYVHSNSQTFIQSLHKYRHALLLVFIQGLYVQYFHFK